MILLYRINVNIWYTFKSISITVLYHHRNLVYFRVIEFVFHYLPTCPLSLYSVHEGLRIKIGDSALGWDLFPDDYQMLATGEMIAVRWQAIEVLQEGLYTLYSDVVRSKESYKLHTSTMTLTYFAG